MWADCKAMDSYGMFPGQDVFFFDDFLNYGVMAAGYAASAGGYAHYIDTGDTIASIATENKGVIKFLTDTTDNDECWLSSGGNTGTMGVISDTVGSDLKLWFECRIRLTQIGNTYDMFVGLAEEGLAAADTVTDAGAMADKDFLGFNVLEADGDAINVAYKKEGQTVQTAIAGIKVPVAATWYKLGFVYDPSAASAKRISFYVDGVENGTYITGTNIAAATFPDGEELALLAGVKNGGGAASSFDMDWWAFAQVAA